HRLSIGSARIGELALQLSQELGAGQSSASARAWTDAERKWISLLANDLKASRESCIVIAGEWQPPVVHAIAHMLNEHLGAAGQTVQYAEPAQALLVNQEQSIRALASDMQKGEVETLVM